MPSPSAPSVADKTTLDTSQESATKALYRAAIGPLNSDYYLPIFSAYESSAKIPLRWNTEASLYTLNWMVFRRLWVAALIYASAVLGSVLLVFGLGSLVFPLSMEMALALGIPMLILSIVVPGLWGNTWLHTDSRRRMAQALSQSATLQQACGQLSSQASSRNRFLGLVLINLIVVSVPLGLYLKPEGVAKNREASSLPVTERAPLSKPLPMIDLSQPEPDAPAIQATTAPSPPLEPITASALPVAPAVVESPAPAEIRPSPPVAVRESQPLAAEKKVLPAFYVNVGLFANANNAEKAHQRLASAGMAVTTEVLATGTRSRVRVGPFPSRLAAENAARSIKALGLDAVVRSQ